MAVTENNLYYQFSLVIDETIKSVFDSITRKDYLQKVMELENPNNNPYSMFHMDDRIISYKTSCKYDNIGKLKQIYK